MKLFKRFKVGMVLAGTGAAVSFFWASGLLAQTSDDYLKAIADNTNGILQQVNMLPTYFDNIVKVSISWLKQDDSDSTAQMSISFNGLGTQAVNSLTVQNNLLAQLNPAILGVPASDLTAAQGKTPPFAISVPEVNNIVYSSLIGKAPVPSVAFDPNDYVKNASAITLKHTIPEANWQGSDDSKKSYRSYFDIVTAVGSYSAYILSNLTAEFQGGNQVTTLQNDLIGKATDANWLATITSEELGKVLRQILLFQSQSFVVQMQSLQIQKQLLTATAMTNAAIIAANKSNEDVMLAKAKGLIRG